MTTAEYEAWKRRLGIRPAKRSLLFTFDHDYVGVVKAEAMNNWHAAKTAKPPPITEDLSRFIIPQNATQRWWANMSPAERRRQCAKRKANAMKRRGER